jgi:hypothetical protein
MIPLGGDFSFINAYESFESTDRFIRYFNNRFGDEFQIMYSTPGRYLDAIIE